MVLRGKPRSMKAPVVSHLDGYGSKLVSCCHAHSCSHHCQPGDLLDAKSVRVTLLLDSFHGSHLASIHTPLQIPSPSPHWSQMLQSSAHPRTFAHALSFPYKALRALCLPLPGLYLNPICSVRLPRAPYVKLPPHTPFPLAALSPSHLLCIFLPVSCLVFVFHYRQVVSQLGRYLVWCVVCCVLSTQNSARHQVGTQQMGVGWMDK